MNKNKGDAEHIAGFINLENELPMNNNLPNFQLKSNADDDRSRRELIEKFAEVK